MAKPPVRVLSTHKEKRRETVVTYSNDSSMKAIGWPTYKPGIAKGPLAYGWSGGPSRWVRFIPAGDHPDDEVVFYQVFDKDVRKLIREKRDEHGWPVKPRKKRAATVPKRQRNKGEVTVEPTIWEVINFALEHDDRIILWGNPGTGKTHAAYRHALNGRPLYATTLTQYDTAATLKGMYEPKGGEFVWVNGIGIQAWGYDMGGNEITAGRLVINEIDKAGDDLLGFLHCLLDDPELTRLTLPTGKTVKPGAKFQVVATTNYNPDETLDRALRDRFSTCINVTDVAPGALEALDEQYRTMAKRFTLDADPTRRMSVRRFFAFQRLRKVGNDKMAAAAVFGKGGTDILDSLRMKEAKK